MCSQFHTQRLYLYVIFISFILNANCHVQLYETEHMCKVERFYTFVSLNVINVLFKIYLLSSSRLYDNGIYRIR